MSSQDEDNDETTLSIGAVSQATGIPSETLRTWERRYGFPSPERSDGGHRQYNASIVEREERKKTRRRGEWRRECGSLNKPLPSFC